MVRAAGKQMQNGFCFFRISPYLCQTPFKIPGYTVHESKINLSLLDPFTAGRKRSRCLFWQADQKFSLHLRGFIIDAASSRPKPGTAACFALFGCGVTAGAASL